MTALHAIVIGTLGAVAALGHQVVKPAETQPTDAVRASLRVAGPIDMSSAGPKGEGIDLYNLYLTFENTTDATAVVFAPDIAKRPELAHGWRFRGRQGTPHPYAVRVVDAAGDDVRGARFAVFVGGVAIGPNGGKPPEPVCEYREELDLLRLEGKQKIERFLGYVVTRRGEPSDFTVRVTLATNLTDERDPTAQRLIRLAGPDQRAFHCSARPTPEARDPGKRDASGAAHENGADAKLPPPPKQP